MVSPEIAQVASEWPWAASLAAAVAARGVQAGRRRTALNEALHELRRPLQALALAPPTAAAKGAAIDSSVQMAALALEQLDREINGEPSVANRSAVEVEPLVEAAVRRWHARASASGRSLRARWCAGRAVVAGDRGAIAQALDNLVVNAIEHGGETVIVEARLCRDRLRLSVKDSGCGARRRPGRPGRAVLVARISGRQRRGHGLRVVRRVAARHGGDFQLRCSRSGTEAALELPLLGEGR
jgi:signal transduction histidine kinase